MGRARNATASTTDAFASVLGTRHGRSYEDTVEAEHPSAVAKQACKRLCDCVRAGDLDAALAVLAENRGRSVRRPLLADVRKAVLSYLCYTDNGWGSWASDLGAVVAALELPLGAKDPGILPSGFVELANTNTRVAVDAWLDEVIAAGNLDSSLLAHSADLAHSAVVLRRREYTYAVAQVMEGHAEDVLKVALGNGNDNGYLALRMAKGGDLAPHLTTEGWRRVFSDVARAYREGKFDAIEAASPEEKMRARFASMLRGRLRSSSVISVETLQQAQQTGILTFHQ